MTNYNCTFEQYQRTRDHVKEGGSIAVYVHGFTTLPCGAQEYSDNPDHIDGWCSMVRVETPDDPQQPFDIILEVDHATRENAEARAGLLAHAFLDDQEEWDLY